MGEAVEPELPKTAYASTARRESAVETFLAAKQAIGPIEKGMSRFLVSRGQFSMLDAILHALDEIGPSSISVWTWAIADYEVELVCGVLARKELKYARLMIDNSKFAKRHWVVGHWRKRFGHDSVRIVKNHAKMSRVWNDDYRILFRGSMNFNCNAQFEQLDVSEGGPEFDLVARIESELPAVPDDPTQDEVNNATSVGKAYEFSTLPGMFKGVKPWRA